MTTITVTGYLYAEKSEFSRFGKNAGEFICYVLPWSDGDIRSWGLCLGPVEFRHTLPEGLDMEAEAVRQQLAALQREKDEAGRKYAETVARINEQISKLTATMLLEALHGMLEVYGITATDYEKRGVGSAVEVQLCEKARAAIAAATGEQP